MDYDYEPYVLDGIYYNGRPHSRVEKILIDILMNGGGGGGGEIDKKLGNGLKVVGNKLMMDTTEIIESGNAKPAAAKGMHNQLDKAEYILGLV